jgi:hypothetical protein
MRGKAGRFIKKSPPGLRNPGVEVGNNRRVPPFKELHVWFV